MKNDTNLCEVKSSTSFLATYSDKHAIRRKPLRWSPRLKMLIVIVAGFILLGVVVSYLLFLWLGQGFANKWTRIVLANWVATSVVMSALIIRIVIGAQLTLCTSLLALNALKNGAALTRIPRLSSLRYSNAGPLELLLLLIEPFRFQFSAMVFSLTALSVCLTITLQFTSTLLVSDLAATRVKSFANVTYNAVNPAPFDAYRNWIPGSENTYWNDAQSTTAVTYPLFAESSQILNKTQLDKDDTGPSIRALLPVSLENGRAALQSFMGTASLYDARWICEPPKMENLKISNFDGKLDYFSIQGNVSHSTQSELFSYQKNPFNCTITQRTKTSFPTTFVCAVTEQPGLRTSLDLMSVSNLTIIPSNFANTHKHYEYGSCFGASYLVFNTDNMAYSPYLPRSYRGISPSFTMLDMPSDSWNLTSKRSWITARTGRSLRAIDTEIKTENFTDHWVFSFDVTFCSSAFSYIKNVEIQAQKASASDSEPITPSEGLNQLGASPEKLTLDERGVLQIENASLTRALEIEREIVARNTTFLYHRLPIFLTLSCPLYCETEKNKHNRAYYPNAGSGPLDGSTYMQLDTVHESRVRLFHRILNETASPALAMQTMQHTILTDRYYKYLPYFQNSSRQLTTFWVQAVQPVRKTGLITVLMVLAVHTLLVSFIILTDGGELWNGKDRWPTGHAIDQAWKSYSQVLKLREEVSSILDTAESTIEDDESVENMLRERNIAKDVFVLRETVDGDMKFRRREAKAPGRK